MARLQDFQSVTPSGSNNLLIVQAQGQGLATVNAVGQKIATDTTISSLTTTSKKIAGAINEINASTNITSQVTWNEDYSNARVTVRAGVVYITYQGEGKTHSADDIIFTIPQGYRPIINVFIPVVCNAGAYGNIIIGTNGQARLNQISSSTFSGRLYFSCSYPIA